MTGEKVTFFCHLKGDTEQVCCLAFKLWWIPSSDLLLQAFIAFQLIYQHTYRGLMTHKNLESKNRFTMSCKKNAKGKTLFEPGFSVRGSNSYEYFSIALSKGDIEQHSKSCVPAKCYKITEIDVHSQLMQDSLLEGRTHHFGDLFKNTKTCKTLC